MTHDYPFRNLVFQGGGVRTFVYHGALAVLEERGILPNIQRVAGASAGAMLAAAVSFRLSVAETLALYQTLDMSKVPQIVNAEEMALPEWLPKAERVKRELARLSGASDAVSRLVRRYGWYSSDYSYNWMLRVIAEQCGGNGLATFAEFRARGWRDLSVVATNISKHRVEVFSAESTPHVAVADALLMSQSLPLFFEPVQFDGRQIGQGDYYADGGLVLNYPLELFDHIADVYDSRHFVAGINWETLGCRHYQPDGDEKPGRPITNVITYMENLAELLVQAQAMAHEHDHANQQRTININRLGVATTDFSIAPRPDNAMYQRLTAEGRKSAESFLDAWCPPFAPHSLA